VGRGAGFRDFLRLPSAKENRSNRRTLPISSHKVDLSICGEVRNSGPVEPRRPFPYSDRRAFAGNIKRDVMPNQSATLPPLQSIN